jgi:Transposase DDE domain
LKAQCTASSHGRTIHRNLREYLTERVRAYHQTPAYEKAMGKRKVWIEPLFGEAKQWHGLRRFRLRRLWKVNCEALITAAGQNVKRLLQKCEWRRRPVPSGTAERIPCFQEEIAAISLLWRGSATKPLFLLLSLAS